MGETQLKCGRSRFDFGPQIHDFARKLKFYLWYDRGGYKGCVGADEGEAIGSAGRFHQA
jgi:hypothetical protein